MSSHPEKIGKYTIVKPLGRGAMGMVYEGHDPVIDRRVAIKVINKTSFDDDEQQEAMARFKREAQAAGKLSHANIVMVYEYGEDDNTAFISMEYVSGPTLQEIMSHDKLTISQVQDFMEQLLAGLDYAHTHNVTHRDIKPANLVFTGDGQIKIMDFGIAKVESSNLTQIGTIMGTPAYMAPELFTGEKVDHRTDLFSAAVILYQLLTGLKPFTGETMSLIMHQVVNIHPPHPSDVNNQLPQKLDALLRTALSKRAERRFGSASEFRKSLLDAFEKIPPHTIMPRQITNKTTNQTILSQNRRPQSQTTRPSPALYIGGAILLIIIATLFFSMWDKPAPLPTEVDTPPKPIISKTVKNKKVPARTQATVKIITPESKKISKRQQSTEPYQQPQKATGISINGRKAKDDRYRSGTGIRITTPSRD